MNLSDVVTAAVFSELLGNYQNSGSKIHWITWTHT